MSHGLGLPMNVTERLRGRHQHSPPRGTPDTEYAFLIAFAAGTGNARAARPIGGSVATVALVNRHVTSAVGWPWRRRQGVRPAC
jgi:hypothetical protein